MRGDGAATRPCTTASSRNKSLGKREPTASCEEEEEHILGKKYHQNRMQSKVSCQPNRVKKQNLSNVSSERCRDIAKIAFAPIPRLQLEFG